MAPFSTARNDFGHLSTTRDQGEKKMSKAFRMHVLAADYGDCLWVEYGPEAAPHRILIDCGTTGTFERLKPALDQVRGDQPSHELLLITHVDEDHIAGALKVLADPAMAAQFKHVWFNGRKHLMQAAKALGDDDELFGPVQGEKLTSLIKAARLPWNEHFDRGPIARDVKGQVLEVELPGGAKVMILTPSLKKLQNLLPVWDQAVTDAGLDPNGPGHPEEPDEDEEILGKLDVAALAAETHGVDTKEANGSSVAMLLEYDGKRILLGADAHPDDLLAGIQALTGGATLKVDVFKLPHHGSKANVTSDLLDAVDADVIVFSSNGVRFRHPNQQAVARVIRRYRGQGKELVFNYDSEFTRIWRSPDLTAQWNYSTRFGQGVGGITVNVG
jgi:beta-lactamase superfamily II metal-dependent hydrolase